MADSEDQVPESTAGDVDMAGAEEVDIQDDEAGEPEDNGDAEETLTAINPQTVFVDYLKSPIVQLTVGGGGNGGDEESTTLTAHSAILNQSPFFAEQISYTSSRTQNVDLPDETLDAVGCFLQYQYTGEYFPRRIPNVPDSLETDPSLPSVDTTGSQLLKHARVYTLAEKLGLPELKTLAHSKIHRINSTAVGEIAYARYVYGNTPNDDTTIRKPVAAFWAQRSHVLRHEAEAEFRSMCLEFPQFGFDVLSMVLDQKEKRQRAKDDEDEGRTPSGKGRKRMRPSVNV